MSGSFTQLFAAVLGNFASKHGLCKPYNSGPVKAHWPAGLRAKGRKDCSSLAQSLGWGQGARLVPKMALP
jgi:hypothetical protein